MTIHVVRLIVESFFAAVFAGSVMVWLYNRFLAELRESYLKKFVSLAVLPLAVCMGVAHGIVLAIGGPVLSWAVLPGVVFFGIKWRSALYRRRANQDTEHVPLLPAGEGLNLPRFSPFVRACLYAASPLNGVDQLELVRRCVPVEGLHPDLDGLRIVHLTDFHVHPSLRASYFQRSVEEALDLNADVMLLGGDFVSKARWRHAARGVLARIAEHPEVYAIRGNHDFWNHPLYYATFLDDWGVNLLSNEAATIRRGQGRLTLIGLEDPYIPLTPRAEERLRAAFEDAPRIGLVHTPETFAIAERLGCAFAIAGHTHGGQIRLPFFGTTIASATLPERLVYGAGHLGAMQTYVSNGIGAFFPVRISCPPQIVEITLVAG